MQAGYTTPALFVCPCPKYKIDVVTCCAPTSPPERSWLGCKQVTGRPVVLLSLRAQYWRSDLLRSDVPSRKELVRMQAGYTTPALFVCRVQSTRLTL